MKKQIDHIVFIILTFLVTSSCGTSKSLHHQPEISSFNNTIPVVTKLSNTTFYTGNNFLFKNKQNLWELYVEGDPLERGLAIGSLSDSLIKKQECIFFDRVDNLVPSNFKRKILMHFLNWYNRKLYLNIDNEYQAEIFGISKYAPEDLSYVAPNFVRDMYLHGAHDIGHAFQDLGIVGCTSFAVWGDKTEDGDLILGRNFDFYAGDAFAKDKIVAFINPKEGYPFMMVTWPGMVGVCSGMNSEGLTLTINAGKSKIPLSAKTPISIVAREIMQYARTIDEAIAIAKKKKVFVSESIMVGSANDNKAVLIEIAPDNLGVFEVSNGDQLVCSNHFQSDALKENDRNKDQIKNSHSQYRFDRMTQLLDENPKITPQIAVDILRNKEGLNNLPLGYGNDKALNHLLALHGIVFQPSKRLVWVSSSPYQLGEFVCYDLNSIFKNRKEGNNIGSLEDEKRNIAEDPFLKTVAYQNYEQFRVEDKKMDLFLEKKQYLPSDFIEYYQSLNPNYWVVYYKSGLYFYQNKKYALAQEQFEKALTKEISTLPDKEEIAHYLKKIKKKTIMIPKIEIATTAEIKSFQEQKLVELLRYVNANSPFYSSLFTKNNIDISNIKTIEDLIQLPVTTKEDLQKHNDDFLCVPANKIIDYATTSGTLGDPVTFGLTDGDLDRLAYNESISFDCAGIKEGDIVQLMTTIDRRFMAGLAYFLGLRKLKVGVIRVGAGIPELQWDSISKYKPTYLIAVPSFLLKMIEYAENRDIDFNNSSVKGVICIGESLRNQDFTMNALSKKITDKWKIKLFSTYASTEMSTAFTECEHGVGGHHHPELIIVEVLDENNNPVKNGESGELTFTTLGIEAMPLVRFKTGDIVQLHTDPCLCGRNTLRVGPVIGRKQHMIKYKGTTLYPPAMHDVLNDFDDIENYIIEIATNDLGTDEILIKIAVNDPTPIFLQELKDHFRAKLRVTPKIEFTTDEALKPLIFNPMSRKPIHFFDNRKSVI